MNTNALLLTLDRRAIEYKTEYSLCHHVSFKLECMAALAIFPATEQELIEAVSACRQTEHPYVLLGRGSNLFFARAHYDGAVILTERLSAVECTGNTVQAACGVSLTGLAAKVAKMGLSGLEFAYGIPGSVGGAVFMNAGAYGGAISDVLTESRAYDPSSGQILTLREHAFGYRESIYMKQRGWICLSATFSLLVDTPMAIEGKMRGYMDSRKEKQPLEYPSAGSYFKRPTGHFAGKLIEECGLKGLRVGGAEVSEKHAGFFINRGGATAADVLTLEEQVRSAVQERFGVVLEREVRVVE